MTVTKPNPYVGPRPFDQGDVGYFFGRDREIRQLRSLLIAERIAYLHSPSGAGKTSLVKAALIPAMRAEDFDVLPVIRVGAELPNELVGTEANRYILSTLLALEEGLPADQRRSLPELAALTLDEYLCRRSASEAEPKNSLLIFDQYEEILITAPNDREGKQGFFDQLGEALRDRRRWALFALREDYIAPLIPYLRPVPGRLSCTYRLDLLEAETAIQAVQKPAEKAGVTFSSVLVRRLVDDLSQVQAQMPDGSQVSEAGLYVEPVQLQVVCYRLWEKRDPLRAEIGESDLAQVGSVDETLRDYYRHGVQRAADQTGVSERTIREWIGRKLISGEGFRTPVRQGSEQTEGLDNHVLGILDQARVVQAEQRSRSTWYELAHDRLIKPVQADNEAWSEENLSLFQRSAALWQNQLRSEDLLLRGEALNSASAEVNSLEAVSSLQITPIERDFLAASLLLRKREDRDRIRTRLMKAMAIGASILFVLAVIFGILAMSSARAADSARRNAEASAFQAQNAQYTAIASAANALEQQKEAEKQRALADKRAELEFSNQLVAQAINQKTDNLNLALLLSAEAYQISDTFQSRSGLLSTLTTSPNLVRWMHGHYLPIYAVAASPDGKIIASAGKDRVIIRWDAQTGSPTGSGLTGHASNINSMVFRGNDQLISADCGGMIAVWDLSSSPPTMKPLFGARECINKINLSPDGNTLVSADDIGEIRLWDLASMQQIGEPIAAHSPYALTAAFNPANPSMLATGGADGKVILWDLNTRASTVLEDGESWIWSVTFSPDGKLLASAGEDGKITIWDVETKTRMGEPLPGHNGMVYTLQFNTDGSQLVSGGSDKQIILWNVAKQKMIGRPMEGHSSTIFDLVFSPDFSRLYSAGDDALVGIWSISGSQGIHQEIASQPEAVVKIAFAQKQALAATASGSQKIQLWNAATWERLGEPLAGHTDDIRALALNEDGTLLASGGDDKKVILWSTTEGKMLFTMQGHTAGITSLSFQPGGQILASSDSSGTVIFWDTGTGRRMSQLAKALPNATRLTFNPDGKTLITAGGDETAANHTVSLLPIASFTASNDTSRVTPGGSSSGALSQESENLPGAHIAIPNLIRASGPLTVSPNGDLLAVSFGSEIILVDLQTQEVLGQPLSLHDSDITDLQFSPDGNILASLSSDSQMVFWDTAMRQAIGQPVAVDGKAIAFDPGGTALIVAQSDGKMVAWDMSPEKWRDTACQVAARNLTKEEWQTYLPGREYRDTCPGAAVVTLTDSFRNSGRGWDYYKQDNYDQAITIFQSVIAADPTNVYAYDGMGWSLYQKAKTIEQYQQAIPYFEKAITLNPYFMEPFDGLGWTYWYMADAGKVMDTFKRGIAANPTVDYLYNDLGWGYYWMLGDPQNAIPAYEQALYWNPGNVVTRKNLARIYNDLGQYDQAIEQIKKLTEQDANNALYYRLLGGYYSNAGQQSEAISAYLQAIQLDPYNNQAYNSLSAVYIKTGDVASAESILTQGVGANPMDPQVYENLARFYINNGNTDQALAIWNQGIDVTGVPEAYANLASWNSDNKSYDTAIKGYQAAISLDSNYTNGYIQMAWNYSYLGQQDKAVEMFNQIIAKQPEQAWPYDSLGYYYQERNDNEKAVAQFKKAIELSPSYRDAYYQLGLSYAALKRYSEAFAAYEKAIFFEPLNDSSYTALAKAYNDAGMEDEAQKTLERLIKTGPTNAYRYAAVGQYYHDRGDNQKAVEYFARAVDLNSNYDWAWDYLGWRYYDTDDNVLAEAAFQEAIRLSPDNEDYYGDLGEFYRLSGQYEKAIQTFEEAIKKWPQYAYAYRRMALTYHDKGDEVTASSFYLKAIEIAPNDAEARVEYGDSLSAQGNYHDALEIYRKATELDQNYSWAWNRLGWCYFNLQDYPNAEAMLQKAAELSGDGWYYADLGNYYSKVNNPDSALQSFLKAIDLSQDYAYAYRRAGDIYYDLGEKANALKYYEECVKRNSSPDKYVWDRINELK